MPRYAPSRLRGPARLLASTTLALAALALFANCGGDGGGSSTPGTATAPRPSIVPTSTAPRPAIPPGSAMDQIRARGKLVVGVKFDQPLFGFRDPKSGEIDGFDIAVAYELARSMGLKPAQVQFVETVSRDRIPALQQGRVDLVVATMSITPDRQAQIDMSRPYFVAGQSILVRAETDDIQSVQSLNGRRVCTVLGSTSENAVAQRAPQALLLSLDGYAPCVQALKDGQVDAVTTDNSILAGFANGDASLKLVGGQFTQELYVVGVPKGRGDLTGFVNEVVGEMLADGTWDRIYQQYLGGVAGLPPAQQARAAIPG